MRLFAVPRRAFLTCVVLGAMSLVAITGCSDDDDDDGPVNPPGGQSTAFSGMFAGTVDGGTMTVSIPLASGLLAPRFNRAAAVVNATGTLSPTAGGTITLTGTYDESSNTIALGGSNYTFAGTYDPAAAIPGITGTYDGPTDIGGFAAAVGGSGTVTIYCGTWLNASKESGILNLMVVGTNVSGVAVVNGTPYSFQGTVAGTSPNQTVSISQEIDTGVVLTADADLNSASGVIANGTWAIAVEEVPTDSGTWQGSTTCSTPPTN